MRREIKKVLSLVLATTMAFSGVMISPKDVSAALTANQTQMVASADYNLALGKITTIYPGSAEGDKAYLNDGALTKGGNHCALSSGWGYLGESYVVIDLGDYYDASTLDMILIQYKDAAANDTVVGQSYSVLYSVDGIDYTTVVEDTAVAEVESDTAIALDEDCCTYDDVSGATGAVRYVKVYYPSMPTYGIQLTEIAVLDTNLDATTVQVESCADPAGVTVSSDAYNELTYEITAGDDQEDYKYNVYLDGAEQVGSMVDAGETYTITGVAAGVHTLKVHSVYDGKVSAGIISEEVTVVDISSVVSSGYNVANTNNNPNAQVIGVTAFYDGHSLATSGSALNGLIPSGEGPDACLRTGAEQPQEIIIDLGAVYVKDQFETVLLAYSNPRTYASNTVVYFAQAEGEYVQVANKTGYACAKDNAGTADINRIDVDMSGYDATGVRYIKLVLTGGQSNWGYVINEIAVGLSVEVEDAQVVGSVTVEQPASVVATASDYNEVEVTITAGANQEDYLYNVYIDGELILSSVEAGTHTIAGVKGGSHVVSVKSVYMDNYSAAKEAPAVTVVDFAKYTQGTMMGEFPAILGNFNNYSLYKGVSASASSGDASNAIDNNAGTRWESAASDPQYIVVDLGFEYSVSRVEIRWEAAQSKDFTVEYSTDGINYKVAAQVEGATSVANRYDTFVFAQRVAARYIKINGTARNLTYGHSIWDLAIYGPDAQKSNTPEYFGPVGYQMNTDTEGVAANSPSFRVLSSVPSKIGGLDVVSYGTVYALADQIGTDYENEMVIGANENVMYFEATDIGKFENWSAYGDETDTNQYYALTFTNNGVNASALVANYVFRTYAELSDGSYVYGDYDVINIHDIAENLYTNNYMSTQTAHDYLYYNVLNTVSVANGRIGLINALTRDLGITSSEHEFYDEVVALNRILKAYNTLYVRTDVADTTSLDKADFCTAIGYDSVEDMLYDLGVYVQMVDYVPSTNLAGE